MEGGGGRVCGGCGVQGWVGIQRMSKLETANKLSLQTKKLSVSCW